MQSLFGWPGGKRNLVKTILARIPAHNLYVEVFAGSAKLLFAKPPSRGEVLNDINGDLINFHRVVKHRAAELAELLEHELIHPDRFRELKSTETITDELHRAARFAYLTWYSFGAKGEHFARPSLVETLKGGKRRPLDTVRTVLEQANDRLRNVRIEQRDFEQILSRFDSPETFFYLDPPYVDYQANGRYDALTPERRETMFDLLAGLRGKFLLSFDNVAEVRELAAARGMQVSEASTTYSLSSKAPSRVMELLVSNHEEVDTRIGLLAA